jgi:hypothetical protein
MRKILVGLMALCLMAGTAHATAFRVNSQLLKVSGVPMNNYTIATSSTVTRDSVYQMGNVGFQSLATMVRGANASITITYQVSYDNANWFTPYNTASGVLTSAATISTSQSADRWIVAPAMLAPYIRFNFAQGAGGTGTITADTLWQSAD